jgi:hypothetical protein
MEWNNVTNYHNSLLSKYFYATVNLLHFEILNIGLGL